MDLWTALGRVGQRPTKKHLAVIKKYAYNTLVRRWGRYTLAELRVKVPGFGDVTGYGQARMSELEEDDNWLQGEGYAVHRAAISVWNELYGRKSHDPLVG